GVDVRILRRAFLRQDRVIRIRREDRLDDLPFCLAVDLAHEILRPLRRDGEEIEIAGAAIDDAAGAPRGLHRDGERGMHGLCGRPRDLALPCAKSENAYCNRLPLSIPMPAAA